MTKSTRGKMLACLAALLAIFYMPQAQAQEKSVLRIAGGAQDSAYEAFINTHGDIEVITDIPDASAQEMQFYVETGTSDIDIFLLDVSAGYRYVREKGYFTPLSGSALLMDAAASYYDPIRDALFAGDDLIAVPAYFSLSCFTVNETLWKECLPEESVPETYLELLDLMERWPDEYEEAYPDILPVEFGGNTVQLLKEFTRQYIFQSLREGSELSFETEKYRSMLERILALNPKGNTTEAEEEAYNSKTKLITLFPWVPYGITYEEEERIVPIPPLGISPGDERIIPVQMRVYIVNPESANKEAAIAYLEAVAANLPPQTSAGMIKNWSEPVLSKRGERTLAQIDEQIRQKEEELKTADEAQKASVQAQVEELRLHREAQERDAYAVSAESIERYRELAPLMCIPLESPFYEGEGQAMQTLEEALVRLYQGKTSVDECIKEMERKTWMIFGEEGS